MRRIGLAIILAVSLFAAPLAGEAQPAAKATERYLAAKSRKRSLTNDKRIIKHLKSEFGEDAPLAEITAGRISEYKARRLAAVRRIGKGETTTERRLTAAAVNRPLALLRHVLRLAHEEWEELPAVPTIRLEREPQGRIRWLEPDEEIRLLDACRQSRTKHLSNVVKVALESGFRRSELLNLTWGQVDLSRGGPPRRPHGAGLAVRRYSQGVRERGGVGEARWPSLPRSSPQLRLVVCDAGREPPGASDDPGPPRHQDDSPVRPSCSRSPSVRDGADGAQRSVRRSFNARINARACPSGGGVSEVLVVTGAGGGT